MNQKQSIPAMFINKIMKEKIEYRTRLNAAIDCVCFLLHQGLLFHGHDESTKSHNQENYLELFTFLQIMMKMLRRFHLRMLLKMTN